jgi:hypothetical protein
MSGGLFFHVRFIRHFGIVSRRGLFLLALSRDLYNLIDFS